MISVILGIGYFCVAWRWQSATGMSNPDMVELAERPSEIAHVKCAHEIMNKLLPNHLLSFQVMKKKNTGVKEVIQGYRAKMNSSDWSGLESFNSEDGWTQVLSKSSKKMLRKKQKDQQEHQSEVDSS